jgi:hypothetical protein
LPASSRRRAFIAFGQRVVEGSDLAQMAFADGRMFWSYQATNLTHFGAIALLVGLAVWWMIRGEGRRARGGNSTQRHREAEKRRENQSPIAQSHNRLIALFLIFITALDLFLAHGRFNPASDPALSPWTEQGTPPVVKFINEREQAGASPWRFTTFNAPGEKTFNANAGMYYGWHDVRGYDSIIPRQYAEFMQQIQPQENELLYNRIAPIYAQRGGDVYAALDNPLLDLLNVKYVITEHAIPNPGWQEIYQDDAVRVYENLEVLPRALIAPEARVVPAAEQPLTTADLRQVIFIEETPAEPNALVSASPQLREANISRYTANELFVDVNLSDRGWLFLGDAWFPGWKAYLRPFGGDESQETELTIHRANRAFRAVYLPADGQWTVRFVYSPMSFKLGLYISFLAAMTLLMLLLYWLWGRYYRPEIEEHDVKRVAKNSLIPMGLEPLQQGGRFRLRHALRAPVGAGGHGRMVLCRGALRLLRDHQPLRAGDAADARCRRRQAPVEPLSHECAGAAHTAVGGKPAAVGAGGDGLLGGGRRLAGVAGNQRAGGAGADPVGAGDALRQLGRRAQQHVHGLREDGVPGRA